MKYLHCILAAALLLLPGRAPAQTKFQLVVGTNGNLLGPTNFFGANTGAIMRAIAPHLSGLFPYATQSVNGLLWSNDWQAFTAHGPQIGGLSNLVNANTAAIATQQVALVGLTNLYINSLAYTLAVSNLSFNISNVVVSNLTAYANGVTNSTLVRQSELTALSNTLPVRLFVLTNDVIMTNVATIRSTLSNYLGTTTLPANYLKPGMRIHIRLEGMYWTVGSTVSTTNTVTLGGTVVGTNTVLYPSNITGGLGQIFDFFITCRTTGASGTVICQGYILYPSTSTESSTVSHRISLRSGEVTVDTTSSLALDFLLHVPANVGIWLRAGYGEAIP